MGVSTVPGPEPGPLMLGAVQIETKTMLPSQTANTKYSKEQWGCSNANGVEYATEKVLPYFTRIQVNIDHSL